MPTCLGRLAARSASAFLAFLAFSARAFPALRSLSLLPSRFFSHHRTVLEQPVARMYWPVAVWLWLRLLSSQRFTLLLFLLRLRVLRDARFRPLWLRDRFRTSRGRRYSGSSAGSTGGSSKVGTAKATEAKRMFSGISLISLICTPSEPPRTPGLLDIRRTAITAISDVANETYAVLQSASKMTEVTAPCLAHSNRTADSLVPGGSLMQTFSTGGASRRAAASEAAGARPVSRELKVNPTGRGGASSASASSSAPDANAWATPLPLAASLPALPAAALAAHAWSAASLACFASLSSSAESAASPA
mmetsp:Transcript_60702/g.109372  ORF Transcript_60702/g.109372 Transcript_60702/m.109372 type:complete len:305 (+) Transcript_60702:233-1147(+)